MEERIHEPKGSGWNDFNSEWVRLHNGKEYLLPVMSREQKYKPVFHADGSVSHDVLKQNNQFDAMLGELLAIMEDYDRLVPWMWTDEMVTKFFGIVREMLACNYSFTDDQVAELLAVNTQQLSVLFSAVFQHILRK